MKRTHIAIAAIILLAMLAMPVHAQSWDSAKTTGITRVSSSFDTFTNTYTWTLTNGSAQGDLPFALIWSLEPFNVPTPTAWTAPANWTWKDNGWQAYEIANNGDKYYTPPSIAPGQSIVFTYTVDPSAPKINPLSGDEIEPGTIGFLSHIAQVVPGSGTLDGEKKWDPVTNPVYGPTWYDKCTVTGDHEYPPVPEPSSIAAFAMGMTSLAGLLRRRNS